MIHNSSAIYYLGLCFGVLVLVFTFNTDALDNEKPKSILAVWLARNKQYALPYFLTFFSQLNYPKDRISLFIRSDHNIDKTSEIIKDWLAVHQEKYHSVDVSLKDGFPVQYANEGNPTNWTNDRFNHVISLKEEALGKAKKMWAHYIWFLDLDVFILEPNLLWNLIKENRPIIAPMLNSLGTYSNYWCGMDENYWYERTDEYFPILERKKEGCFPVPMVHSCILIDLSLSASDHLSFDSKKIPQYNGPNDDIITMAVGAKNLGTEMYVCNDEIYGYIPSPLDAESELSKDYQYLIDLKLDSLIHFPPWSISKELLKYAIPQPSKTKLGFDNVYLINLVRRPDRKEKMLRSFDELGIDVEIFDAVDGKRMNASYLDHLGVKQLGNFKDPWAKRDMTYGEIGCFLSHYYVWEDIVKNQYEKVIMFEDDIRFEPFFIDKLDYMMDQMDEIGLAWDLVYLGRKKLKNSEEPWVDGSNIVVHVDYSYWTLCYIVTLEGARKLLKPRPLGKMVPVDEYIPIMFNKHPEVEWKAKFGDRNLSAFSASPLMVFPTHYTGEKGYVSDTEASPVIEEALMDAPTGGGPTGPPLKYKGGLPLHMGGGKEEL